jgi:hypothetical protein
LSEEHGKAEDRRRFLKIVGGGAVLVPILGISACSGGEDKAAAPSTPKTDTAPKMEKPKAMESGAPAESTAPAQASGLPKLSEDDPQAKSLSYVHDATTIDASKQPRYKAGQACRNCALYQGKSDDEWAGCSIFPGRLVNGAGWCSVYAPKPA